MTFSEPVGLSMVKCHRSPSPTPLAVLIQTRMQELGLDRERLGFRLGYHNSARAAGRVDALCDGLPLSTKSRRALGRLAEVLQVSASTVSDAVADTESMTVARARQAEEARQLARERNEAEWRSTFEPHAVLLTESRRPNQITLCAVTGGVERWLTIRFDLSRSPLTFVQQVRTALSRMTQPGPDGQRSVVFFGELLGFVVNYSPEQATRFDLLGGALEILPAAYRLCKLSFTFGSETGLDRRRDHLALAYPSPGRLS